VEIYFIKQLEIHATDEFRQSAILYILLNQAFFNDNEIVNEKFETYKSSGTDTILAKILQGGGKTLR
jgi:hypothetical protein